MRGICFAHSFAQSKIGSCGTGNNNFASLSTTNGDGGGVEEIKGISDGSPSQSGNLQVAAAAPLLPQPQPFVQHSESMSYDSNSNKSSAAAGNASSRGPQFVLEASKNVTALAGRVASLSCRIKNLDNWTVIIFHRILFLFFFLFVWSHRCYGYSNDATSHIHRRVESKWFLHLLSFNWYPTVFY